MSDTPTPWFRIGHTTHAAERTGCTAIVFDQLAPTVVDQRGGAPGTRETDLLGAGKLLGRADALLLTGGSAFGLAAADGVMRWLAEQGRGFPTAAGPVPIVPAAVIFDLAIGAAVAPDADDGYAAAAAAAPPPWSSGPLGAGAGATVAKLGGAATAGGLGTADVTGRVGTVWAVVALNAVGDVRDPEHGAWLARSASDATGRELAAGHVAAADAGANTTIGAVLLSAPADRDTLTRCCVSAHDALARCVVPAHTLFDGDTLFAAAPATAETAPADTLAWQALCEIAVERAIVGLFTSAT